LFAADRTSRACSPNTDNEISRALTVTPTESAYDDVTERLPGQTASIARRFARHSNRKTRSPLLAMCDDATCAQRRRSVANNRDRLSEALLILSVADPNF